MIRKIATNRSRIESRTSRNRETFGAVVFSAFAVLLALVIFLFLGLILVMGDSNCIIPLANAGFIFFLWLAYGISCFFIGWAFPKGWLFSGLVPIIAVLRVFDSLYSCNTFPYEHAFWILFNMSFGSVFVSLLAGYLGSRVGRRAPNIGG
jgi:hypothetical protein